MNSITRKDTIKKIVIGFLIVSGVFYILAGKFIFGGISLALALAVWMVVGGNSFNARNIDEKVVTGTSGLTIREIYNNLMNMDTCFGRCWLTTHDQFDGSTVCFGPGILGDYIVIGGLKSDDKVFIISSTDLDKLHFPEGEYHRKGQLADKSMLTVNAGNYALFASYKLVSAVMIDDLRIIIENLRDGNKSIPDELCKFKLFHYDTRDSVVRDFDDNEYGRCSTVYEPLSVVVYDNNGIEKGSIVANGTDDKGGYLVTLNNKILGTMYTDKKSAHDEYYMHTAIGEVRLVGFRAVRSANLSCNYTMFLDGKHISVMGANARIKFEDNELVENNILCSFDEEYLYLQLLLTDFILAKNRFIH